MNANMDEVFADFRQRLTKHSRNNDSAVYYGNELVRLAQQSAISKYLVMAYAAKGSALEQLTAYDSAIYYYELAKQNITYEVDSADISFVYTGLGICYYYKEWYDLALENFQKNIALFMESDDLNELSRAYSNVGMVLLMNGMHEDADIYLRNAYNLALRLGENSGILPPLNNLSENYLQLANYDSAIYYAEMVKEKSIKLNFPYGVGMACKVTAEALLAKGDMSKAKAQALEGIQAFESLKANRELDEINVQLVASEIGMGNNQVALNIIKTQLAKDLRQIVKVQLLKLESDALANLGRFEKSLEVHRQYVSQLNELNKQKSQQEIAQQQQLFDTQLKGQQIDNLKTEASLADIKLSQQRFRIYGLFILLLLLVAGGYLYLKQQKVKSRNQMMELETRLLRTQLNPHFLFNAMGAIQQYLYSQEDPQLISDYLGKFSKLTRMILNYSKKELITLEDELDFLNHYVDLQKIRFEEPFDFKLEVLEGIEPGDLLIPPMLTQPFIENAIEHGFLHKEEKGHIKMRLQEVGKHIQIVVTDDGIGRTQAATFKKKTQYQSMATQITKDRLKLIQKRLKSKANLLVTDLLDQNQNVTGTEVQLNIPLIRS